MPFPTISNILIVVPALLLAGISNTAASFGARVPPPQTLLEAQAVCVKYLGICEDRLRQYNNSIYPTDRDTMCMVRCAGIIVGFWDDTQGLKLDGLSNLFPQLAADTRAQHQIMTCAEHRMATCQPQDACAKAYNGFRCFLQTQQNGFGLKDAPSQPGTVYPMPFSGKELANSVSACTKILRIPKSLDDLYIKGIFPNDPDTRCLIRCVGIRTGLYDDVQGPNIALLHKQCGGGQSEADFRQRAFICMNANQPMSESQDKCSQAYRKLYLCFKDAFGALIRTNANTMSERVTVCV